MQGLFDGTNPSGLKATGQYLAVTSNGRESRKITQLLHPTVAA
jgi:hypothetical protein